VKNIAPYPTTEAMENLLLARDCKRGGLLRMERAQCLVVPTTPLERKVLSNHLGDVVAPTNLFNAVLRDMVSHKISPNTR
jgi:hypothetical protein